MGARINAYDPVAAEACRKQHPELKIQYCQSCIEAVTDADAVVIVTEWKEFAELDLAGLAKLMAQAVMVDGRNIFDPEIAKQAGFSYTGVGRREKVARKPAAASLLQSV
jgi:UDPglucose 6-dehydrogenase